MIYDASAEKLHRQFNWTSSISSTCGLVAMTSASHAEGRQFDPGQVYLTIGLYVLQQADALAARPKCPCVCVCGSSELQASHVEQSHIAQGCCPPALDQCRAMEFAPLLVWPDGNAEQPLPAEPHGFRVALTALSSSHLGLLRAKYHVGPASANMSEGRGECRHKHRMRSVSPATCT